MNRDDPRDFDSVDRRTLTEGEIVTDNGSDEPEVIRANIEQTRAEMSETIDAIQERLSPSHLKEQAQEQFQDIKEQVREQVREQFHEAKQMVRDATIGRVENMMQQASDTVQDTRTSVADTIRQNPIPAALVGIGLGWLFMNRSSSTPVRYSGRGSVRGTSRAYDDRGGYGYNTRAYQGTTRGYDDQRLYDDRRGYSGGMVEQGREMAGNVASNVSDTASNLASRATETASNVASNVSETASNLASNVSETASNLADQAQYQAQRVEDRFERSLQSNPLAVGAIALALGTAVGLALPQTERENEWMGEARDTLIDRASEVAQNTIEKVQSVASDVVDDTKQTVKEQAREHGLSS